MHVFPMPAPPLRLTSTACLAEPLARHVLSMRRLRPWGRHPFRIGRAPPGALAAMCALAGLCGALNKPTFLGESMHEFDDVIARTKHYKSTRCIFFSASLAAYPASTGHRHAWRSRGAAHALASEGWCGPANPRQNCCNREYRTTIGTTMGQRRGRYSCKHRRTCNHVKYTRARPSSPTAGRASFNACYHLPVASHMGGAQSDDGAQCAPALAQPESPSLASLCQLHKRTKRAASVTRRVTTGPISPRTTPPR